MSERAERWVRLAALFDEVADLAPVAREARLAAVDAHDPALARELRELLAADASDAGLLDGGIGAVVPELLEDDAPTDRQAGPWRLLRRIGEGGMGVVWLAERIDGAYERQAAVKLLKRGMDSHAILRRFLQERRILARLQHEHIVRLIDGGMGADGRPYYAMDYVEGEPITRYAARHRLDARARVELLVKVAGAVAHAHTQLIVHRDLKPSNVLVDAAGEPRVLDFGIAKLIEESGEQTVTGTGLRVLSPAYAAPEQVLGEPIGTPTDVYALGLMLCELLTGALPQHRRAAGPLELAREVASETPVRASALLLRQPADSLAATWGQGADARTLARVVAGDIDLVIATALQREPARRYPTVMAFAGDLVRWLQQRPITARGDSRPYRLARFVRRNRAGVAAGLLAALSLMIGLGVALWQADEARRHALVAERQAQRAERVKAFLVGIFRQNDPALARDSELSAAEILRRSRAGLDAALAEDPETRAELLIAIAEIQLHLGEYADGLANAERALPALERQLPPADARLAAAYRVRGELNERAEHVQAAEADLRKSNAILAADPVRNAAALDEGNRALAYVINLTRSPEAASALQRQVLARVRARLGDASPVVAEHRLSLALLLEEAGQYAEAEQQYGLGLPILSRANGELDPAVCEARSNYAGLLDRLGRSSEAVPHFAHALDCRRQLYGAGSLAYGSTLFSRGILLLGLRRAAEAEADFRTALAIFTARKDNYSTAHAHRYLGRALIDLARPAEAARELAESERLYRLVDLPNDSQRWRARADYGYALYRGGDAAGGRAAIERAIAGLAEVLPQADAPEYLLPLRSLGEIARAQGDLQAALRAHRRWRELAVVLYGAASHGAWEAAYELSLDLAAAGQPAQLAEAATLIDEALSRARAADGPEVAEYEKARERIVALGRGTPAS